MEQQQQPQQQQGGAAIHGQRRDHQASGAEAEIRSCSSIRIMPHISVTENSIISS